MWVALQISVCVIFLLLAAFWAGKKLGQRKFFKLEQEMKALELSFKHLTDDIEMVASHNIKALDGQCNVLKELLTVADKKCLYANDLLKEIDDGVEALRKRNLNPANALTSIDQGHDKRFRKEVQDTLEEMLKKIAALNTRVSELEGSQESNVALSGSGFDQDELKMMISNEVAVYLKALEASFETYEPAVATANGRGFERSGETTAPRAFENAGERSQVHEKTADKAADRPVLRAVGREPAVTAANSASGSQSLQSSQYLQSANSSQAAGSAASLKPVTSLPLKELRADVAEIPVKKTDLCRKPAAAPPPANFRVNEVLRLYSEGYSLPQIARNLNMGKGEIELIIKIYGESLSMRNVL